MILIKLLANAVLVQKLYLYYQLQIYLARVVGQNPGKDWILHEVIVRPTSQCVEVHQVLEVRDFSILQVDQYQYKPITNIQHKHVHYKYKTRAVI